MLSDVTEHLTRSISNTETSYINAFIGCNSTQAIKCVSDDLQVAAGAETAHARCPQHVRFHKCAQQDVWL